MKSVCEEYIRLNNVNSLCEWMNESELNCNEFWSLVSGNSNYRKFICENVYFLYFGKLKRNLNVFQDEDLNLVATTLGAGSVYSEGKVNGVKEEFLEIKEYKRPENFMEFYREACEGVDVDLAFGSIMQILAHSGEDFYSLLIILSGVIVRTERGTSSLITSSLVSILEYIKGRKGIRVEPLVQFLESVWETKDEQDKHGVASSSLISFSTNLISQFYAPKLLQLDGDFGPLSLANLVCKHNNDIYRWVGSISTMQSEPVSGPLDTVPLNDAVCLFVLLKDDRSNIPRVYSLKTIAFMVFKLSNVFLSNQNKLTIDSANLGLRFLEKEVNCTNSEPIRNINTFPWYPIGYLSALLDSESKEWNREETAEIFKAVLSQCSASVKLHILKGVVKFVKSELGTSISLMECKNTVCNINKGVNSVDSSDNVNKNSLRSSENVYDEEEYFSFVKNVLDSYFGGELVRSFGDSVLDSLSIVLNWIKFLLLSKNCLFIKKNVKICYLQILTELYSKLNEEYETLGKSSHKLHIPGVSLNKLDLIKMLFIEVLDLLK
uniref:Uncharacterized protein n=1 Tax=Theileria annulata TaxID=5874 RepID=A0A3B0MRS6_THEAN